MATIKMTTRDSRFDAQSLEVTTITTATAFADLGGQAKYLRYIQFDKNAGTLESDGHAYLNIYNTGEVTVGTTEPVMRIQYPHIDTTTTHYSVIIPFGMYFNTTISFAVVQKDGTVLVTGGVTPNMNVRLVMS